MLARGEKLPPSVDFTNRLIYYVGPVDQVRDEIIGSACPTTATRMDKFIQNDVGARLTGALFSNKFSEALQKCNEQLEVQGAARRRT
jgi:tartrate dehydratase beta subunit/fumarate hydratase class I family protein